MCFRRLSVCVYSVISAHASSRFSVTSEHLTLSRNRGTRASHADDLHHHALPAPSVELRVEHLLPWAEVERARGDREDHLVTHDGALQVSVGVVLPRLMVLVRQARR